MYSLVATILPKNLNVKNLSNLRYPDGIPLYNPFRKNNNLEIAVGAGRVPYSFLGLAYEFALTAWLDCSALGWVDYSAGPAVVPGCFGRDEQDCGDGGPSGGV